MTTQDLKGRNTSEKIYNFFIDNGFTKEGACAVMANLDHESGLKPNNLQDSFESKLGTDTYYTSAVNAKTYTKDQFINDQAGYGLAQWTYYTRKKKLYEATVEKGLSIGDLYGQLCYLMIEIAAFKTLDNMLRTSHDMNACCDLFLKDFEAPLIKDYEGRRKTALKYYNLYASGMPTEPVDNATVNPETTEYKTYTVKAGDSWWSIAADKLGSGTRMNELAKLNNMTIKNVLQPNMIIILPELKEEVVKVQNTGSTVTTPDTTLYTIYTVQSGDSWWKIAASQMKDGSKMHELAKYNGRNTASILYTGEKIKIPVTKKEEVTTSTANTHKVKAGESWWSIAQLELGNGHMMNKLAEYNGKTIKTILHPGNILKIPPK